MNTRNIPLSELSLNDVEGMTYYNSGKNLKYCDSVIGDCRHIPNACDPNASCKMDRLLIILSYHIYKVLGQDYLAQYPVFFLIANTRITNGSQLGSGLVCHVYPGFQGLCALL